MGVTHERIQMELQLRERLSPKEYERVIKQLEGAVAAIDLLSHRAPAFLRYFFTGMYPIVADGLPEHGRSHLVALVRELREQHEHQQQSPAPRQPALRLVKG